jgi:mxaD protein
MFNSIISNKYNTSLRHFGKFLFAACLSVLAAGLYAQEKVTVMHEETIGKDAASVWEVVGDFNGLSVWHPAVAESELQGSGTSEGDTRLLTLGNGATINETLKAYDAQAMMYQYAITESPLPVADYVSSISVEAIDDSQSKVIWQSTFMAQGATDEEAAAAIKGIYVAGLDALKAMQ